MVEQRWVIKDHLCRNCGGRILKCVSGGGMTAGGNPIFKCADCGRMTSSSDASSLCWCGTKHKNNHHLRGAYTCRPFSEIDEIPELKNLFLKCGCDPERGEVGIVLRKDYEKLIKENNG